MSTTTEIDTSRLSSITILEPSTMQEKGQARRLGLLLWQKWLNPINNTDPSNFSPTTKNVILVIVAVGSAL
jgi:hypothetical protein